MTALRAYDAADPGISIPAMLQHGGIIAPVYIVGSPGGFGHADRARVAALRNAGLAPLPNWERAANFFSTCTIAQARAAGVEALTACRDLGFPDDGSIDVAFSFDYNIPAGSYGAARARLVAASQGLAGHYRAIAYGPLGFLNYLAAHGQPGPHWLMASTFQATSQFTAAEVNQPCVGFVQSHDANGNWLSSPIPGTDVNTVIHPDALGAWWPDGSPYGGNVTPDDIAKLAAAVWQHPVTVDNQPDPKTKWTADHVLQRAYTEADAAGALAKSASDGVAALKAQLVALQAVVAAMQPNAALGGTATVQIDLTPK